MWASEWPAPHLELVQYGAEEGLGLGGLLAVDVRVAHTQPPKRVPAPQLVSLLGAYSKRRAEGDTKRYRTNPRTGVVCVPYEQVHCPLLYR